MVDFAKLAERSRQRKADCERLGLKKHILDCIPWLREKPVKLRDVQEKFLIWVQENWKNLDVLVGELPVAAGKSICLVAIGKWCGENDLGSVAGLTPTTILQDQYSRDFPDIPMLKGASHYKCLCNPKIPCDRAKDVSGKYCDHAKIYDHTGFSDSCPYIEAKRIAAAAPLAFFNFHSVSFNEMWKPVMCIDEGHNSENHVIGRFGLSLWECEFMARGLNFPENLASEAEFNGSRKVNVPVLTKFLGEYLAQIEAEYEAANTKKEDFTDPAANEKLCKALKSEMQTIMQVLDGIRFDPNNILMLFKKGTFYTKKQAYREFNKTEMEYIYIKPLKVDRLVKKVLWPEDKVKKIVFFSATFNQNDLKTLGLSKKRCGIFKGESPIPVERREVRIWPVASMTYRNRAEGIPKVAAACLRLASKHHDTKGVLHCTYEVADEIRQMGFRDPNAKRLIFHTQRDKKDALGYFLATKEPKILVASGMSEGIDLAGHDFGWQVLTMIVRPSIVDDVNFWRLKYDKEKYDWETVRQVEQTTGRISRFETDMGVSYVVVNDFWMLWNTTHLARIRRGEESMWADWFIPSVKWSDGIDRS